MVPFTPKALSSLIAIALVVVVVVVVVIIIVLLATVDEASAAKRLGFEGLNISCNIARFATMGSREGGSL